MTIDDKGLLPCPYCGGKAEITYNGPTAEQVKHAISWGDDVDWQYYGECAHCGATGPACISETEAIAAWNRRPSPALSADDAGLVAALKDIYETDDHARGCEGRTYDCTCGFDDRTFATAQRAAARIEALTLPTDNSGLVELIRSRIGEEFDNEAHFTADEAERIAARLEALSRRECPFEIVASEIEAQAVVLEQMRSVYPGDPTGAMSRDAKKMRRFAKQVRRYRPTPPAASQTAGGEGE
jgi:Lar family restriction alleviation protein